VGRDPALIFLPDPKTWFSRFMAGPGIKLAAFTPDIAIDASWLPGELHGDPGDRMIIATARHLRIPVVTRDRKMIAYGAAGHADVIAC
jgi:PIN domain nuclease of toxin-antitoxin system